MKSKSFLTVNLLLLITRLSFSQTVYSSKEQSTFSFNIGMTSTGVYRDTISYFQGILFNGGVNYLLAFSDKSNIGIECLYSGKAFKRSSPIIKYRFTYVDIPVYYQYKFSENIRADIGVQYSKYLTSQYYYLDGSKSTGVHKEPLATKFGDDFGVLIGTELGLTKNFFMGLRYSLSANSFLDNKSAYMGLFQFSFKLVVYRGYREMFSRKKAEQK